MNILWEKNLKIYKSTFLSYKEWLIQRLQELFLFQLSSTYLAKLPVQMRKLGKKKIPPVFKKCINEEGYTSWMRFLILMKIGSYQQCPSRTYNQEEAGAQGLRLQRLMVLQGTQKLVFCFLLELLLVWVSIQEQSSMGFQQSAPSLMPQYKLYYFHGRILQNSRFVKIYMALWQKLLYA